MLDSCEALHQSLNTLPRYHFPFDKKSLPSNGIYFLFEAGEMAHEGQRIVRIGTHRGQNQLANRLIEHFVNENKNRSIFRKNIGRCFLNEAQDDYLSVWNLDSTSKENREKYGHLINKPYQEKLESRISQHIQQNFSFVVLEVEDLKERLRLEKEFIQMVSSCPHCHASTHWLGHHSPQAKIRTSGLWQTQHLKINKKSKD